MVKKIKTTVKFNGYDVEMSNLEQATAFAKILHANSPGEGFIQFPWIDAKGMWHMKNEWDWIHPNEIDERMHDYVDGGTKGE